MQLLKAFIIRRKEYTIIKSTENILSCKNTRQLEKLRRRLKLIANS